jgi:hypothetical protein
MDYPSNPGYAERYAERDAWVRTKLHCVRCADDLQRLLTYRATGEISSDPPPDEDDDEMGDDND